MTEPHLGFFHDHTAIDFHRKKNYNKTGDLKSADLEISVQSSLTVRNKKINSL